MPPTEHAVAVLHQATPPVDHGGLIKAPKPGGYRDSGADIAVALRRVGVTVITPESSPDPAQDIGWTFPDTKVCIEAALATGATTLWANTVLFDGHPIERWLGSVRIVGQLPATVGRYDDKVVMNRELRDADLPVVRHAIVTESAASDGDLSLENLDSTLVAQMGFDFPLVVKPVRGRGSAGVTMVDSLTSLHAAVTETIASRQFGSALMIEPYLPGEELTITVMPPAGTGGTTPRRHWCLPPVRRFNHHQGIAPYNGSVAVVHNSEVLSESDQADPSVLGLLDACRKAAEHIDARAPIRIDCRGEANGDFLMFDVNLKPNMTGPGRPGRGDQLSLTGMAAAAIGMSYGDLILTMLGGAWH